MQELGAPPDEVAQAQGLDLGGLLGGLGGSGGGGATGQQCSVM